MRNFLNILKIAFIVGILASCSKDYVSLTPTGSFSDAAVWKDPNLVETFVNNMYRQGLGLPFSIERLSDYVDESNFTPDWGVSDFNKSLMTVDGLMGWDWNWSTPYTYHFRWAPLFSNVRNANIFLAKIDGVPFDASQAARRVRLKGETFFLRAYTYHYLVAMYGGVPILTKAYTLNDSFNVARNTYEECINFIVSDCDSAIALLPTAYTDLTLRGRATRGAAMALKARTLLYAASDLHTMMSTYAPGYPNPELLGYTTGTQAARWVKAMDASKAIIDSGWYSLYKPTPAASDSIAKNFADYFTSYGYEKEDILLEYFTPKTDEGWQGYNPALYCGPNGYHNWGNNCPLGDLVDDYSMRDGTAFDWNSVDSVAPYSNREARFYATVLYEGSQWRVRPPDVQGIDPFNRIQTGAVYDITGANKLVPGVDTRSGPIEDWNGGYTGYYLRKFVDQSLDPQFVKQDVPFRFMRYAEVLLNYAEACIEVGGHDAQANAAINQIRVRAGQPPINLTGAALKDAYRHERRIEMAFEDQRFWDVRRWMIGSTAYHQMHNVTIKYMTASAATNYRQADGSTWGAAHFTKTEAAKPMETRAWNDKAYFFPIMRDEANKNKMLIQNPGY